MSAAQQGELASIWYTYRRDRAALAALGFLLSVVLLSLLAPWLGLHDPADAVAARNAAPGSEGVLLGADGDGRDVLSRLLWGGRLSLLVGIAPTMLAMALSLALGIAAGYFGGWLDQIIMRVLDVFFAFPLVLLAIVIAGVLEPGVLTMIIAITIALVPYIARLARTLCVSVRAQPFVEAAVVAGANANSVILRYVLPNVFPPVFVYTTTLIGLMMVVSAGLSFLGLGVQPPDADWGSMVADGRTVLRRAPHVTLFPGLLIIAVALAFNFVGDGLRAALDPQQRLR